MNCNIVKDLIPLYIDGCCSEESGKIVSEHIKSCSECKKTYESMKSQSEIITIPEPLKPFDRLNDWKASVLQSVLLFLSFGLITVGVALEAKTPFGSQNGFWALNLVVPVTGFMLSLANWYFVKLYKSRKAFSCFSLAVTFLITLCAYIWSGFHYEMNFVDLFLKSLIGIVLTIILCILSKLLSGRYAKMLGKE